VAEDLSPTARGAQKSERFLASPGASEDRRKVPVPFQASVDPGVFPLLRCIGATPHGFDCLYGAPHAIMVQTPCAGVLQENNKLALSRGGLEPRCASAMERILQVPERLATPLAPVVFTQQPLTQHPIPYQGIPSHRMHGA
jgi:hypothetical protein